MNDTIKDAIIALQNGESSKFKDTINTELMSRAMDAIQVQKISAGQAFFDEPEAEIDIEDEIDSEHMPEEEPDEEV